MVPPRIWAGGPRGCCLLKLSWQYGVRDVNGSRSHRFASLEAVSLFLSA